MAGYTDYSILRPILAVKQFAQSYGRSGKILPIAFVNSDGTIELIQNPNDEFPNNGQVWVSSEYDIIEEDYETNELFAVPVYSTNNSEYEIYNDKDKYWAKGGEAKKIQEINLYPIIEIEELPSSSSPYVVGVSESVGQIFLSVNGIAYGPFTLSKDESGRCKIISPELHIGSRLGLNPDHVFSVDVGDLVDLGVIESFEIEGGERTFINNSNSILYHKSFDQIDYISDEKLLSWGLKHIQPEGKRAAKREIENWKKKLSEIKDFRGSDEARRLRLIEVVQHIENLDGIETLVKDALLQNKGLINEYIKANETDLLGKETGKLKERAESAYREERNKLEAHISELEDKEKTLTARVEELKRNQAEIERKQQENIRQNLEEKEGELVKILDAIQEQIKEKEKLLTEWMEKESVINEIEKIKKKRDAQQELFDELNKKHKELKEIKPEDLIRSETKEWLRRGGFHQSDACEYEACHVPIRSKPEPFAANYVEDIQKGLEHCNRSFDYDEVANILITVQNSFLTVFSGEPGCGKTSLAYLLADVLGLKNNFLPISVARGWASQRDILGFFNPINSTFQESKTGLYSFIKRQSNVTDNTLNMILLDEANLSPLEHYWSEFLPMSDPDPELTRRINIGSGDPNDDLEIGHQIRFVATVNNDNTTERLSPRLINRAAILTLPEVSYADLSSALTAEKEEYLAITYDNFNQLFVADETADDFGFTETESDRFKGIYNVMTEDDGKSQRMTISPRKINAILRYCAVANIVFKNPENALDYAIAQHVLPTIEGFGESFGCRLEKLQKAVARLPRSRNIMQSIISRGNSAHHSYSFFA